MVGIVSFKLRGAKELEQMLKALGPRVAIGMGGRAVRAGARPIIKDAKARVPKRTGELRRSIAAQKQRGSAMPTVLIGFRPPVSRRAHLVEFGTSHSAAKPFMRPALDSQHQNALREMLEILARGILREEFRRAVFQATDWEVFDENATIE